MTDWVALVQLPLATGMAVALLSVGRGVLVGALERTLLSVALVWVVATGVALAGAAHHDRPSTATRDRGCT